MEGAEGAVVDPDAMVDDAEMAGVEGDKAIDAGEESDEGSEDLEAESSGSDDDDLEEEEEAVEGEADDMEMDGVEKPNGTNGAVEHHADAVMAH